MSTSSKMTLEEFKAEVKARGVKALLEETTDYGYDRAGCYYAEKAGDLIGYFSPRNGGVFYDHRYVNWSKSKRTFNKVKI